MKYEQFPIFSRSTIPEEKRGTNRSLSGSLSQAFRQQSAGSAAVSGERVKLYTGKTAVVFFKASWKPVTSVA